MAQRHAFSTSILTGIVAGLFSAGCQNKPPQGSNPPPDSQVAMLPNPQVVPPAGPPESAVRPGTAEALTQKVAEYAQRMGPLVVNHPRPATNPAEHVADPSAVDWMKPGSPLSTPRPLADLKVVPVGQPLTDSTPSAANQVAFLPGSATANPQSSVRVSPEDLNHAAAPAHEPVIAADLEAKLARRLQDNPRNLWAHFDYQMLHFLRDEKVAQPDALATLPLEDRELIEAVMDGMSNFRNGLRLDNNMLLSKKVQPFLELADRLRAQADLNIPVLALCTKVDGFGVYEPIDPARFVAAKEHLAIVYCEVENFASTPITEKKLWETGEKKVWETKLTQEAVLYTEGGLPVWQDKAKSIVDQSRNRRHDFFVVKMIKLPATLTIGRYLLKVTVTDEQAKRVAEQTVSVEIVAQ